MATRHLGHLIRDSAPRMFPRKVAPSALDMDGMPCFDVSPGDHVAVNTPHGFVNAVVVNVNQPGMFNCKYPFFRNIGKLCIAYVDCFYDEYSTNWRFGWANTDTPIHARFVGYLSPERFVGMSELGEPIRVSEGLDPYRLIRPDQVKFFEDMAHQARHSPSVHCSVFPCRRNAFIGPNPSTSFDPHA
jgi:hypothetical protein